MTYPTDLTDRQWRLLEPVLGTGGSRGPQPRLDRRLVVDAILYQARTGCQWLYLPAEFGPWNTIWKTFARWRDRGVWQQAMDVLRCRVRRQHGRRPEPSMLMVDCQVTKGGRAGPSFHQQHGNVHGVVTIDCGDGDNWRTVTSFNGQTNLTGITDCYHLPVSAAAGKIVELFESTEALIPNPDSSRVELDGAATANWCGCGGWDSVFDEVVCANNGIPAGTSTGGIETVRIRICFDQHN